jgi:hypothetical protein
MGDEVSDVSARGTSRRSLLGAALAVTGLAGTGFAAKLTRGDGTEDGDRLAAGSPQEVAPSAPSVLYLDRYSVYTAANGGRGGQRSKGDQTVLRGTLTDADGARAGEMFASALTMPGPIDDDTPLTPRMEIQNLHLSDGVIIGMGTAFAQTDIPNVYSVVGGSGRYHGARGVYTFDHNPNVARPEGEATISFDLDLSATRVARSMR